MMPLPDKDLSIVFLVEALDLGRRGWVVVDDWDADLCAVGIAREGEPSRLVYVSSFGRGPERYDYECEISAGAGDDYEVTARGQDVDLATVVSALETHLSR